MWKRASIPNVSNIPDAKDFGDTLRVVTIYDGSQNPGLKWTSASFNLGGMFDATFSPTDAGSSSGGFLVTTGDVRAEGPGSRNAVAELIVPSSSGSSNATHRGVVLDVTRKLRGDEPVIGMTTERFDVGAPITGLTAGAFSSAKPARADVLVATTTAKNGDWLSQTPILNTARVSILVDSGTALRKTGSFAIDAALLPTGEFGLLDPRSPATSTSWQPGNLISRTVGKTKTLIGGGGPDYDTNENVPMP